LTIVIDDDDAVRDSLSLLLAAHGFDVRCFASAEEFLAAEPVATSAVLVDQNLPGISGLDLLRTLVDRGGQPLLGLISARMDPHMQRRAEALGAHAFDKPASTERLIAWLGGSRKAPRQGGV
jgi:two-component system response regulator TtrR